MSYVIGVDIGGTFTDCYVMDDKGSVAYDKATTTPDDFTIGVLEATKRVSGKLSKSLTELLQETRLFVHGCTVATNAVINRSGAKTGLITTKGFEDTILIMRARGRVAGLSETEKLRMVRTDKPEPIVSKPLIKGVRERIDYKGRVVMPLQDEDVIKAFSELVDSGATAIAVCLLWSFSNPSHEKRIKEMIGELQSEMHVTISSELCPLMGEYERTATSVLNAYISNEATSYFNTLEGSLRDNGLKLPPLIMQVYGGCLPIVKARQQPITSISSGPAGGVLASQYLADLLGYHNVITTDVGGTSFDVGLILKGEIELINELVINQYTCQIRGIKVESVGAGGGSICWVQPVTGLLQVGPRSSGAQPGPACYNIGGVEPTVTDADLVLGYLNPEYFLGGRMGLQIDKAHDALEHKVAGPLGVSVEEAAAAIYDIMNAKMADLIRKVTVERGYDPRDCVLFAYGGAGPLHAGMYAEQLKIKEVIVPTSSAVQSAMGAALSNVVHSYSISERLALPTLPDRVNVQFEALQKTVKEELRSEGFGDEDIIIKRYAEMKYRRQVHTLVVQAPLKDLTEEALGELSEDFEIMYDRLYGEGAGFKEAGIEIATLRVDGIGKIDKPIMAKQPSGSIDPSGALKGKRDAFFRKLGKFTKTRVFDMGRLRVGNVIEGPAIVETPITTIVVHPHQVAEVDPYLNVIIKTAEGS